MRTNLEVRENGLQMGMREGHRLLCMLLWRSFVVASLYLG